MSKKVSIIFSIGMIALISLFIYRYYKSSGVISDIKVIFNGKGEYKCEVTNPFLNSDNFERFYIKNQMMRTLSHLSVSEFDPKVKPISFVSYIIIKDGYSYTGSDQTIDIYRKKILETDTFKFFDQGWNAWNSTYITDLKYSCKKTEIPDSLFELPIDGKFIDY